MSLLKYFALFGLLIVALSKPFNPKKVVYAVDCGSTQSYMSRQGFEFQADKGYSENTKVADYSSNPEAAAATIKYTLDTSAYMTERHADETFYYDIPVRNPGKYVLISKFSENWMRSPRQRIFNIMLGNCVGEQGIDIFEKVGRFAAYDSYIEFELRNNNIYVKGELCSGAYINNKLRVFYTKIGVDNPMVDAIVLFEGELADTDYHDIPTFRKEWDRRVKDEIKRKEEERIRKEEARLKRKEKSKTRNDEFEDYGDDFEEGDFRYVATKSIGDYIQDYLGLGIVLFIGGALVYLLAGKAENSPISFDTNETTAAETKEDKTKKEKKEKVSSKKTK